MAGLSVKVDLAGAVRDAAQAFEALAVDRFPRAVQFALTGVAIDGVRRFREDIPNIWNMPNKRTRDALRYVVDKDALGRIASVGEASAAVFIQDQQSTWLKYSFGDGTHVRPAGDTGIEAYFADQNSIRVPVNENISYTGLGSPTPSGKLSPRDAKSIALKAAAGYSRNTAGGTKGSGTWGVFEVKPGDTRALAGYAHRPGVWARPARAVASVGRKRLAKAIKAGKASAPTTTFNRRNGIEVTVPRVVNLDTPRLLFLATPQARYEPVATPSWDREMKAAALTMADRLQAELVDRLEHLARKR
ncbi:hypothetical protein [uncultured Methylobacterium sp.]|uniref:hypothetical protein n=1 Tax=uncultured Methylobacterium sp. TaxID=157278 RepID=UPI0035CA548E